MRETRNCRTTWTLISLVAASVVFLYGRGMAAVVIETLPVGNPGNVGELSGSGAGGAGPTRICGAVDYEYWIGKYEVTTGQYTEFLNAVAATDTYGLYSTFMWTNEFGCKIQRSGSPGSYTYSVAADWVNRPVTDVSWGDAARFANWLHNGQPTGEQALGTTEDGSYFLNGATSNADLLAVSRSPGATWVIPTEDEWYKAAYHKNDGVTGNYWDYPTTSDVPPTNDMIDPDPGNNANFYGNNKWTIGPPYYRTEVGEFENSASPYGTFDQGGNVWEWNEEVVLGSYRGVRGGSFGGITNFWELHASVRNYEEPAFNGNLIGFRLAVVPEPGTLSLLALGGLGLMGRRLRRAVRSSRSLCRGLLKLVFLLIVLVAASREAQADTRYTVIDLSGFDPAQKSAAYGVNNAGQVVGWAFLETGPLEYSQRAFLWENGTTHDLGALPGEKVSCALAVNDTWWVAGQSGYAAIHATAWHTGSSGRQTIYDLGTLGGPHSFSFGINDAGQVVGESRITEAPGVHAFLWTLQDGMIDLGTLPISPNSTARGINNLGQVVGFTGEGTDSRAFIWKNGTMRYIDADAEQASEATFAMGINGSGLVVGSMLVNDAEGQIYHACVWDLLAGVRTDLGVLAGFGDTSLKSVNAVGQAVGLALRPVDHVGIESHAMLYESGSLTDLNSLIDPGSGWILSEAWGINDNGWIVGTGVSPSGQTHGFLLVPEPGTLLLLALGGLGLIGRRRRGDRKKGA